MTKEFNYTDLKGKTFKKINWYGSLNDFWFKCCNNLGEWRETLYPDDISFYHIEELKKGLLEGKDIILGEDEDDTETLEEYGYVATNLSNYKFKTVEQLQEILQIFKGSTSTVYITDSWLYMLKVGNESEPSNVFLKELTKVVKELRCIKLDNGIFHDKVENLLETCWVSDDDLKKWNQLIENSKILKCKDKKMENKDRCKSLFEIIQELDKYVEEKKNNPKLSGKS